MSTWEADFTAARQFESIRNWPAALEGYRNLYHNGHDGDSAVVFHYGLVLLHLGDLQEAHALLAEAVAMEPDNDDWRERLTALRSDPAFIAGGSESDPVSTPSRKSAEANGIPSISGAHTAAIDHSTLAAEHKLSGRRRQEIQTLEDGLALHGTNAAWHIRLGEALEATSCYEQAADAYAAANRLDPSTAEIQFREGFCLERCGKPEAAATKFSKAVALDEKLNAASFGVGVFYQHVGAWTEASSAYTAELANQPHNALLAYRTAQALEKCYEWEASADMYRRATAMDPSEPSWHYRRGFVYERLERWSDAAEAYAFGLATNSAPSAYWSYRCGFVLERLGRYEEACAAHLMAKPELNDTVAAFGGRQDALTSYAEQHMNDALEAALRNPSATANSDVAEKALSLGLYRHAATAYQAAIDRSDDAPSDWYYRLGKVLTLISDFKSAAEIFRMSRTFDDAHGVNTAGYRKDKALLDLMHYTSWRESLPLREKVILYESFHGDSISCNPLAIFEEITRRPEFSDYLHVWVAKDAAFIPHMVKTYPNVAIVRRNSAGYRRHLATAKYLINNVTFPSYFAARPGQQYLNTWHGTPLKTLGKDIGTGFLEHNNVARNLLHATHILAANEFTAEILTRRYDVDTIMSGRVAVTGYPRVDRTLNASQATRTSVKRTLGISASDARPVVLYAPTWRGGLSTTHFDTEQLKSDLARLSELDCNVVFRAHHRTQELLTGEDLNVPIVPDCIETNDLLAAVDILITDYSSIVFDFLATSKPAAMYTPDLDEYRNERGLYIDPRAMGLPTASTIDELLAIISEQITRDRPAESPAALLKKYCPREDGNSSARAVDFFFFGDDSNRLTRASRKKSLLFHHGFIPNEVTNSLLDLLSHVDPNEFDVTVLLPVNSTAAHPERVKKFEELPHTVRVIGRVGRQLFTPEEKSIVDHLNEYGVLTNSAQMKVYRRAFEREFIRIFGHHTFTSVIEFEGQSSFWTSLMAFAPKPSRRFAFFHDEMRSEWQERFPYLASTPGVSPTYDALMSFSEVRGDDGRFHLGSFLGPSSPGTVTQTG